MAVRTRLISDPKYQHVNINVDDDFEEAHHQGKNIGLINFKKASPNSPVKINYNNANPHINYSNMNTNNNLDPINYNNKNNMNSLTYPQYNNQNIPNNNTNYQYNPMSNQTSHNYQQSYQEGLYPQPYNNYPTRLQNSNMPILYPPQEMNPNSNNNLNFVPNHSPKNIHPENVMDISVSYKNYELDEDKKKQEKNILAQALRNQMEQKENLKKMEKERKKEEDRKEEERLRKEREQMQFEFDKENEKKKRKIEEVKAENHKMIVDGVFVKAKPRDRQERKQQLEEVNKPEQIKFIVEQTEEKNDDQIKRNVENEISKLRNNLLDQQNEMLKQINELKAETQNANLQRYDALREISQLKEELANQRQDEDLRRKYVYDVLVDNSSKINHVYSSSKISNYDYFPIDEPKQKKKKNNNLDKMIFKEEIIKYPNRIPNLPDLDEAQDINLAAESKFIDVDTHFVMDGLHLYEPKANKKNIDFHSRQKAIQIEDDFIPLSNKNTMQEKFNDSKTSRFSDKPYNNISKGNFNRKVNEDIEKNKYILKEENLSVNQIYNKNMDRLKYLNNLENDNYNLKDLNKFGIDSHHNDKYPTRDGERNIENPDDNYDDFLNKISNLKLEDKTYTKGNYQEY